MSKYLVIPLFVLLLAGTAQAQETGTPSGPLGERYEQRQENREERREDMKEHMAERRAQFASSTERMKANLSEHVKDFVIRRAEHIGALLDAMIERLNKIADRIDARIEILSGRGVDTDASEASLAQAREALEEASDAVDALKDAVAEALESETPREALKETKPLAESTKTAIKEAHAALVETITSLPNAQNGGETN